MLASAFLVDRGKYINHKKIGERKDETMQF